MKPADAVQDGVVALVAGYVSTKAMKWPAAKSHGWMPEGARAAEDAARPPQGPPYRATAARASERVLGVELDDDRLDRLGLAVHYLTGAVWTPLYMGLRRRAGLSPLPAGLALGASQCLLQDLVVTPLIGASAPNPDYPLLTHLRGFVNHLAYGVVVAGVIEAAWCLLGRRP